MATILLLTVSNVFMTFAWYGHLKDKEMALPKAIAISWSIALLEYIFMVPANRIGHRTFTLPQLKVIQEVVTLLVFAAFTVLYMREELRWNHAAAFSCLVGAVFFTFRG